MLSDYDFGLMWSIYVHYIWWDELSNGFCNISRNIDKIPNGSHWLQWFLELRLLQKTAMLVMSGERDLKWRILDLCQTIAVAPTHPPISWPFSTHNSRVLSGESPPPSNQLPNPHTLVIWLHLIFILLKNTALGVISRTKYTVGSCS